MSDVRYDIVFTGQLQPGAELATVKLQLQTQFKLSDAVIARLFSGERVAIKRGVNVLTATRYRELFQQAGAIIQLVVTDDAGAVSTAAPVAPTAPVTPAPLPPAPVAIASPVAAATPLTLAPPNTGLDDLHPDIPALALDTSHLSLVQDANWTLADCAPPPLPQPLPDIDSLSLAPLIPVAPRRDD